MLTKETKDKDCTIERKKGEDLVGFFYFLRSVCCCDGDGVG